MDSLITPAEADRIISAAIPSLSAEEIPLASATGRILANDLVADRPLPPFDRVMMDGICFRGSDLDDPPLLKIHGLHPAGAPNPPPLPTGHCWEVMTGACLPADCDTVVPYEELTRPSTGEVSVPSSAAQPGRFIHRAASDFVTGAVLAPAHTVVDSRVASVAATIGASTVPVLRQPRIVILSTGDELVPIDAQPEPHQVRQSNTPALRASLARLGAHLVRHEHLPDDPDATTAAVQRGFDSDLLLLCGGISKGKRDFVRPVLESQIGPPAFHGIAQRPGKPLAFWHGPPPVVALPGNPMSVLICFHRYVRPLLEAALRQAREPHDVQLAAPFRFTPPLTHFLPVGLRPEQATLRAHPQPLANSGDFASAIGSQGFIELPPGQEDFLEGFLAPYYEWI